MHFLYILYSKTAKKYYVGETRNPETRLEQHNGNHFKKGFTNTALDWEFALCKKCKSKKDAVYLEKFIKRMKSRKFVEKIVVSPEILVDLLKKR